MKRDLFKCLGCGVRVNLLNSNLFQKAPKPGDEHPNQFAMVCYPCCQKGEAYLKSLFMASGLGILEGRGENQ